MVVTKAPAKPPTQKQLQARVTRLTALVKKRSDELQVHKDQLKEAKAALETARSPGTG